MENQPISSHVVVISQHSGKLPENPAKAAPAVDSGVDFANLLTAQLNGQAPTLDASAAANGLAAGNDAKPAQPEKPVIELNDARDIGQAPQDSSQLAAALNALPLPHLPIQQALHIAGTASATEKIKPDALPLDAAGEKSAGEGQLELALGVPAKETADPAKIAAQDKPLPVDVAHELKAEAPKAGVDFPAHMAQMGRQESLSANTAVAPLPAVDVRLGQPGWDTAFSQRVTWAATNNQQVAQLQLNPPNLGPVEVRITISNDQANAVFVSPHASVRDAIEAALPRLREMLADSGLSMGNVNVSSQSFQQQQQQQQQAQAGQDEGKRHGYFYDLQGAVASEGVSGQAGIASARGRNGLVDIFA